MQLTFDYKPKLVIFVCGLCLLIFWQNSEAQIFERHTSEAGLNLLLISQTGTNGVSIADYNNDGNPDIYFVLPQAYSPASKGTWNRLYKGNSDHTFSEINKNIGVYGKGSNIQASYMGKKTGASWGDFDNDGFPDLFLTHAGPDQLLYNNGDGTFTDITETAGLAGGANQFSSTALWFDYDTDGDLDLYVSVWDDYAEENRTQRNRMYENLGDGNFQNVSELSGLDYEGDTWMALAFDFDKNGFLDLYLANDFGDNVLYINNGDKTFTDRTIAYGLQNRFEGMGLAIGDANNDGKFDFYLTNATEKPFNEEQINPLFIQKPDTTFESRSKQAGVELAGWGWGTQFFDYDNDEDEDIFIVNGYQWSTSDEENRNRFFRNNSTAEDLFFEEVSEELGLADVEESRAFIPFDYNDDGFLDLLISNFTEKPFLYKNTSKSGNWLKISLEGSVTNRNGFGSVIEIQIDGKVYKRYHHGAHFYGQSILPVHFGLGEISQIDRLTVHWLNGHVDEITNLEVNQTIKIKEMQGIVTSTDPDLKISDVSPQSIELVGNYPNPFNGTTRIQFKIKQAGNVTFDVFNILGQNIYSSVQQYAAPGQKTITWNTTQKNKAPLNTGIYFYRVALNSIVSTVGKMNYIK